MFKISNKPNLFKFLTENITKDETKEIYKETLAILKKEKIFRNTRKLENFLKGNLDFKSNKSSFIYNLSSYIFEFSRRA